MGEHFGDWTAAAAVLTNLGFFAAAAMGYVGEPSAANPFRAMKAAEVARTVLTFD